MSMQDPLGLVGTIVDQKYKVESVVGEGGFAVVYRAQHVIWNQPVALKCFAALAGVPDQMREELLNGFIQEGKLMTSLSSRTAAIVQARDVGTLVAPSTGAQVPFMVLEWLAGMPMDEMLQSERDRNLPARTLPEVMQLLEPVASAFEVVHAQNIAHRDIKPANLFVMGDARGAGAFVKILDFGIAKVMSEHAQLATSLAKTGKDVTAFTPNYGAPEQFSRTHGATGPWTDVFALALIVVEMLRGGVPALDGEDYIQLAVASRDPSVRPTPRSFGIDVSDDVERVFWQALAVSPRDRYRTAGAFWAALHAACFPGSAAWSPAGTGSGFTQSNPGAQAAPTGSGPAVTGRDFTQGSTTTSPSVATTGPAKPTKPTATIAAVAALLGVGGGITAFVMSRDDVASTAPTNVAASVEAGPTISAPASGAELAPAPAPECPAGMALIPGGKFFMGSDEKPGIWSPAHNVTLSPYCMGIYEVTAAEYRDCVASGSCKRAATIPDYPKAESATPAQHEKSRQVLTELCNMGDNNEVKPGRDKHPVNCVTWEMANLYCKSQGGRLPTEAEWEFAARGSDGRKFPWGDDHGRDPKHMNACGKECTDWSIAKGKSVDPMMYPEEDGYVGTAPVGSFPSGKTKFGMYDMIGNVWEWTHDYYGTYTKDDQVDPTGAPAGDRRAMRGGGFNGGYEDWVNPAFRYHQQETATAPGLGFRCAKPLR